MSDEDEDAEPAVSLGEHTPVEGAPLARVSSRLTWPKEKSEVRRLEATRSFGRPTAHGSCRPSSSRSTRRISSAGRSSRVTSGT